MPAETLPDDRDLLDLAHVRLTDLLVDEQDGGQDSTLDVVMRRLFDPQEREHLTVSAFSSAL